MLSLYWKIFLGFWFTSLALVGIAVSISFELRKEPPLELRGLTPVKLIDRSTFIVRRLPNDIEDWKSQLAHHDIHFFIKRDQHGKSPLSTPIYPDDIEQLFEQLNSSLYAETSTLTRLKVGRREISIDGEHIAFVLDMPSGNIFRVKELARHLGVQLLLALLLSGFACYILARYLTRNLEQLSAASRVLASGDLTARVKLSNLSRNDELSQLGNDFNEMAAALESSIENQKRLVRDISHELRSPLTRLQIALELARQKGASSELDRIEKEAIRLNELIGQILSIPNDSEPLNDTIDLVELLEAIIDDCMIEADIKSVKLLLLTDCREALVAASAEQLHSALENITRNAIHYTADNTRVTIELQEKKASSEPTYEIAINDCGPGVPEQDIQQIFEPFYRVDRARNRKTGGYGIGLAIVQRVIQRHQGRVSAKNIDSGLSIEISLPARLSL